MEFKFEKKFKINNEYVDVFELYETRIKDVKAYITNQNNFSYICCCKNIFKDKMENNYNKINTLEKKKGVYCFYEENNDNIIFWYIGECHVVNNKWDITYRLKQHFQESQSSGLLKRVMDKHNLSREHAIEKLNNVKIGYFDLSAKDEASILLAEYILITNCDPIYNKE
mgnify:CR=1 FL=1